VQDRKERAYCSCCCWDRAHLSLDLSWLPQSRVDVVVRQLAHHTCYFAPGYLFHALCWPILETVIMLKGNKTYPVKSAKANVLVKESPRRIVERVEKRMVGNVVGISR